MLLGPLARLLRPLVRLMLRAGVTFPVLAELLRGLYIDVAMGEGPRSDSRVSLLTGIHRKELRRQRAAVGDAAEPAVVTLNSQLIGRWLGDPSYLQADGRPLPLPRSGPAPSFEALVAGVTRDLRPRAVLDEWLFQGVAGLDAQGRVVLAAAGFLPAGDVPARLFYFARNLHDHIAAASANIVADGPPPFVDRSVHYDGLGAAAAAALEAYAREASMRLLVDVNRVALGLAEADGDQAGRQRVNLGVFVYAEAEPAVRDAAP